MFRQRMRVAIKLTSLYRTCLVRPKKCYVAFNRISYRRFQDTRKDGSLLPDQIRQLLRSPEPFTVGLLKPLVFSLGFTTVTFLGCAIWEFENRTRRYPSAPYGSKRGPISRWWSTLQESEKLFVKILVANVLVFGAWRIRPLLPIMVEYFLSNPNGRSAYASMVLSAFSHHSFMHLAGNMFVLDSFMPPAVHNLGKEQFVGMYLSGAVISNLASFAYKIWKDDPGLSLGASGAIMTVLGYVCFKYPDTKLSILFLPQFKFSASSAMIFMMIMDFVGILMGSKVFDHAAHFGGALFGIFWCWFGSKYIWGNRDTFIQFYRSLRRRNE